MPFDALLIHRLAHRLYRWHVPLLPKLLDIIIFVLFNTVIHHSTVIGDDTLIGYRGMSVLIHRRAVIGSRVTIGAHVVIGGRSGHLEVPVIEDNVYIGANACVLGPVTIGRGTTIGAGAVVLTSTPEGAVVAGVPARIIRVESTPAEDKQGMVD